MTDTISGNIYWHKNEGLQFAIVECIDDDGLIWAWVYKKTSTSEAVSYEDIDLDEYVYSGMKSAPAIGAFNAIRKLASFAHRINYNSYNRN